MSEIPELNPEQAQLWLRRLVADAIGYYQTCERFSEAEVAAQLSVDAATVRALKVFEWPLTLEQAMYIVECLGGVLRFRYSAEDAEEEILRRLRQAGEDGIRAIMLVNEVSMVCTVKYEQIVSALARLYGEGKITDPAKSFVFRVSDQT